MSNLTSIPKQSYFSAQLQSPIDASQTTGISLTAVPDFTPGGEKIYFNILDSGGKETISATGWTGTTLTGVTRAEATYSGETATGYAHSAGITVVLSDDWTYFSAIQTAVNSKLDTANGVATGSFTIPNLTETQRDALTPTNGMLCYNTTAGEFQYYDGGTWQAVGTASVPNASTTVAGIIELATPAERAAGTATGGSGATLVPTNDALVKTSSGAGDENKIAVLGNTGKFDTGFIDATTTPTASKIVRAGEDGLIADGWLSTNIADKTKLQRIFTAGEDLTAGNAVIVSLGTDSVTGASYNTGVDNVTSVGGATWASQTFLTTSKAVKIISVTIHIRKNTVSPTGNVEVSLRATSAGLPTGTDLGTQIATKAVSDLAGSSQNETFTFSEPVSVSPNTTYAIIVRNTAGSAGDVFWSVDASSPSYTNGSSISSTNSGSSWSALSGSDNYFTIAERLTSPGYVYKADASANDFYVNNFVGFVDATVSKDATATINIGGIDDNQTGLTIGSTYYLSDTSGAIGTSAGTVTKKVGMAVSTTEILIKNDN